MEREKTRRRMKLGLVLLILSACPAICYVLLPLSASDRSLLALDLQPGYLTVPGIVIFMLSAFMLSKGPEREFSWRTKSMSLSFIAMTCYYIVWVFFAMGRTGLPTVFQIFLYPSLSLLFAAIDRRSIFSIVFSVLSAVLLLTSVMI